MGQFPEKEKKRSSDNSVNSYFPRIQIIEASVLITNTALSNNKKYIL